MKYTHLTIKLAKNGYIVEAQRNDRPHSALLTFSMDSVSPIVPDTFVFPTVEDLGEWIKENVADFAVAAPA